MTKNRKYAYAIEQKGSAWKVQITRQITSRKTVVSKTQDNFANEADAKEWAEQQLLEFTSTLSTSNKRHGEQRKLNEEKLRLRSAHRAEKTQAAKQDKIDRETELANSSGNDTQISSESD